MFIALYIDLDPYDGSVREHNANLQSITFVWDKKSLRLETVSKMVRLSY